MTALAQNWCSSTDGHFTLKEGKKKTKKSPKDFAPAYQGRNYQRTMNCIPTSKAFELTWIRLPSCLLSSGRALSSSNRLGPDMSLNSVPPRWEGWDVLTGKLFAECCLRLTLFLNHVCILSNYISVAVVLDFTSSPQEVLTCY